MESILVAVFDSESRARDASHALDALSEANTIGLNAGAIVDWVIDLDDAVAMYRDYDGKLRVKQSYELTTGEGAAWGGLWGSLIGARLAIPFTGGAFASAASVLAVGALSGTAVGATAGALNAEWWKEDVGIDNTFVSEVGALAQPGDSVIFALIESAAPLRGCRAIQGMRRDGAAVVAHAGAGRQAGELPERPLGRVARHVTQHVHMRSTAMSTEMNMAKKAVHDKIESQINTVQAKLETLKAKAQATKANAELKLIADLLTKKQAIDHKLSDLKKSTDSTYQQTKSDVESRIADLEQSVKSIEAKFKAA